MYRKTKRYYESINNYFPGYSRNPKYIPPKRFLWDIFWIMDPDLANKFIVHLLKLKNLENKEGDETVDEPDDVVNELQ